MDNSHNPANSNWPRDPGGFLDHGGWVRSLATAILRDEGLAEEVAQDTWLTWINRPQSTGRPVGAGASGEPPAELGNQEQGHCVAGELGTSEGVNC